MTDMFQVTRCDMRQAWSREDVSNGESGVPLMRMGGK